jgi:hypothetical protein
LADVRAKIRKLAEQYRKSHHPNSNLMDDLRGLYLRFIKTREGTLVDALAASAALGAIISDYPAITSQMREAFELANPNVGLESLADRAPDSLLGFVNNWKGKYFEVLVRDELNAGKAVGDIQLGPGQRATLAESPTQEGWDLLIENSDGSVARDLQLKATETFSIAKEALDKNPTIEVLTTEEVLEGRQDIPDGMLSSGMSEQDLEDTVRGPLEDLLDSPLEDLAESAFISLPFVIIAVGEGRRVLIGKKSFQLAFADSLRRSAKSGISIGMGALVQVIFQTGLVSLPVTFLTRLGLDRNTRMNAVALMLDRRIAATRTLLPPATTESISQN